MFGLPTDQGRASEAFGIASAIRDPGVEVGAYHDGFHLRIASHEERE